MEDLFNPSISTLDLCNLHQLSLPELAATLESETFKQAVKAFERINAARSAIIEPEAKALAAARLADQLKDKPTTPAHAETQRKAATKILSSSPSGTGVPPVISSYFTLRLCTNTINSITTTKSKAATTYSATIELEPNCFKRKLEAMIGNPQSGPDMKMRVANALSSYCVSSSRRISDAIIENTGHR